MALSITLTRTTVKDLHATALRASQAGDHAAVRRCLALIDYATHRCVRTVAATLGVHGDSVYTWLHTLLVAGVAGLRSAPRVGRTPKLTGAQKARLRELLLAGPEAAGYATGAWHSPLVTALIEREFGVRYAVGYLPALLRSIGFSYQKARFVSDHLNEELRHQWLTATWPAIVATAQAQNALLLFGDEASFAQWGSLGYTWAPVGQQPTVLTTGRRKGYKVWGLVEWFSGDLFWAGQAERLNGAGYCAFLGQILAQTERPLVVIQDGARYHTSKEVQAWQAAQGGRLTVYQLPSYSPDYNPIEHLWREVKAGTHNSYFATFESLIARVTGRLAELAADAPRVWRLLGTPLDGHARPQTRAA
ncbi:MAG: IS630 family transposase [Chloroflexota bacterium]|nr:IS630 family transposase [Chloroflexota bacterium]